MKQLLPALKIMIFNLELNHQDLKVEAVFVKAQSVANSLIIFSNNLCKKAKKFSA